MNALGLILSGLLVYGFGTIGGHAWFHAEQWFLRRRIRKDLESATAMTQSEYVEHVKLTYGGFS